MTYRVVLHSQRRNVVVIETDYATEELANEIHNWVTEHNLGTRIAFLMWKLKNEPAITLFLMRWSK